MHKKRRRPENLQSFFPFLSVFAHDGGTAFICLLVQLVRNPPIQPEGKKFAWVDLKFLDGFAQFTTGMS